MATIDVADYIRVGFAHDVGVDQSRTGNRGASGMDRALETGGRAPSPPFFSLRAPS
jgi:hypothetical protein